MSYIYDRFPDYRMALGFAYAAASASAETRLFNTVDEANAHDPFPYELHPPIVHVERDDADSLEEYLRGLAEDVFGGKYAGT